MKNLLADGLARYLDAEQLNRLRRASVAIAGAGGLGSNAAMMLGRCGVGAFFLFDHDTVDASNLNRQQYWPRHVGRPKVEALAELLCELNPEVRVEARRIRLDHTCLPTLLPCAPVWVEALDNADDKAMLVQAALLAGCKVVSATGIAGYGGPAMRKRRVGDLVLVGDFVTGVDAAPPLAPRVTQAAALLADAVLEMLL